MQSPPRDPFGAHTSSCFSIVIYFERICYGLLCPVEFGNLIKALPSFWRKRRSGFRIGASQLLITVSTPLLSSIQRVLAATWQGAYSFLTCAAIPQGRIIGRSIDDAQESLDID